MKLQRYIIQRAAGIPYTTESETRRLGGNAASLAPFETRCLSNRAGEKLLVTGTPARQGPIGVDAGDVIGFASDTRQAGDLLYITGDTLWFEGTTTVAKTFAPQVVVLYTGAAEPRQDQLADVFAKFNLAHRLTRLEKGTPLVLPL